MYGRSNEKSHVWHCRLRRLERGRRLFLLEGLRRLEYRGYDSSGVVTADGGAARPSRSRRVASKNCRNLLKRSLPPRGTLASGIRAGQLTVPATDENAHPHLGGEQVLALVHNGVIENLSRDQGAASLSCGCEFRSDTDSEVVAQLLAYELENLLRRGQRTHSIPYRPVGCRGTKCTSAIARNLRAGNRVSRPWPEVIVAARLGSPLVIGVGDGENFIASDGSPLAGHTEKIVYLADHEIAVVTADTIRVIHRDQGDVRHDVKVLDIEATDIELGGFEHYMLKEIYEQPETVRNAMRGRLDRDAATAVFGGLNLTPQQLQSVRRFGRRRSRGRADRAAAMHRDRGCQCRDARGTSDDGGESVEPPERARQGANGGVDRGGDEPDPRNRPPAHRNCDRRSSDGPTRGPADSRGRRARWWDRRRLGQR